MPSENRPRAADEYACPRQLMPVSRSRCVDPSRNSAEHALRHHALDHPASDLEVLELSDRQRAGLPGGKPEQFLGKSTSRYHAKTIGKPPTKAPPASQPVDGG